jgi:predicted RND superfamily exporter protein
MLIGLGIDFGIQVICRYVEERALEGRGPSDAVLATLENTGASILTAGLTTAVSFAVTGLAGFAGVRELGVLAGGGIIISTVTMLTLLPAVILLGERSQFAREDARAMRRTSWSWLASGEKYLLARPHQVIATAALVSTLLAFQLGNVSFDWNVLHLQDPTSPSVVAAGDLLADTNRSILSAVVLADNLDQARRLRERLSGLSSVASVLSVDPLIPADQGAKVPVIRKLQADLASLPPLPTGPPTPVDVPVVVGAVRQLRAAGLLAFSEADRFRGSHLGAALQGFVAACDDLLGRISDADGQAAARLNAYQASLFDDLFGKLRMIENPLESHAIGYDTLPPVIRHQLVGRDGRLALIVSPSFSVWDRKGMEAFLHDVREEAGGATVTGSVVQVYDSTRDAIEGYIRIAEYALAAIVLLVVLHFRAIGRSLLALTPLALGLLWMFGMQGFAGVHFNVINMLALPLILGIGVANGIYVVRRFDEEGTASIFTRSTGRAILLSNLAAAIGFGSLLVSRYQAMYSFGLLMALGVTTCMVASLVVLPAILSLVGRRRTLDRPAGAEDTWNRITPVSSARQL